MFTLFCYLFALVPVVVATGLWLFNRKVVLWELLVVVMLSFASVAIFNYLAIKGMMEDKETWSGQVVNATYQPEWLEYYEYAVYRTEYYTVTVSRTDSKGRSYTTTETRSRQVFDHWEPSTRMHSKAWSAVDTLVGSYGVDEQRYSDIKTKFGGTVSAHHGSRSTFDHNSRMLSGDPNDYTTINTTNHVYPVTTIKSWENRVKAAPSLFSFPKVPADAPVFEYPSNNDRFTSDRLFGTANGVSVYKWDQLNAELGPSVKVNLIAVGFKTGDMGLGLQQEAKWIGGKKNDIVLCFGGDAAKPTWTYVFGWTEKDIVKKNLESLLLSKGLSDATLPEIKNIVNRDYVIKDWKKFDYLTVEVPFSCYIWLIVINLLVCGGWVAFALLNEFEKDEVSKSDERHWYTDEPVQKKVSLFEVCRQLNRRR